MKRDAGGDGLDEGGEGGGAGYVMLPSPLIMAFAVCVAATCSLIFFFSFWGGALIAGYSEGSTQTTKSALTRDKHASSPFSLKLKCGVRLKIKGSQKLLQFIPGGSGHECMHQIQ